MAEYMQNVEKFERRAREDGFVPTRFIVHGWTVTNYVDIRRWMDDEERVGYYAFDYNTKTLEMETYIAQPDLAFEYRLRWT